MAADPRLEAEIVALGERIFELAGQDVPSVFDSRWWSGKVMDWSMKDEAFKVEMFRFVDVFPTLRSAAEIAQHLKEYFCRPGQDFPAAFQWGLKAVAPTSLVAKAASAAIRKNMEAMAKGFIAGRTAEDALSVLRRQWDAGYAFTVDLLGEATLSEKEALDYQGRYAALLDTLAAQASAWPDQPALERADHGPVPRVNVSVKVSAMYSQLDPLDFDGGVAMLTERLTPLFVKAHGYGAFLNLDVEQHKYKELTYEAFKRTLEQPELRGYEHAGIVCQAYLRDSLADLQDLGRWAKRRGAPVTVRLVKGAYWDYETIHAAQQGHGCPVYTDKALTDANFEACAALLIDQRRWLRPAIGSHNVRSLATAMAVARAAGVPDSGLEVQMLYGMAEPLKSACRQMGYRVREYAPVGELIPGMAYLVRRLLENTSNEGFLRASFVDKADRSTLLGAPRPRSGDAADAGPGGYQPAALTDAQAPGRFRNEPLRDFVIPAVRQAFGKAVDELDGRIRSGKAAKKAIPLFIGGKELRTEATSKSVDPADPARVVAVCHLGGEAEAAAAMQAALAAWPGWRATPAVERSAVLFRAAKAMRARRDDLSALQVFEVGKPWAEADADVCEAIDFLEYYGREMIRLDRPQRMGDVPGEQNDLIYRSRGVGVVIAPWNFPLAIITGMTSAAVVAGNPVIVKPAEPSPAISWSMVQCFRDAGLPAGVLNFLPGPGRVVGARLVEHPQTRFIVFTGSNAVGLKMVSAAAVSGPDHPGIKRVICELGGKNAVIVDADADLDEAVAGVVHSAFGYAGQKCSACSRAIVLDGAYDEFVARLKEATLSLRLGAPSDPATAVGPVVDPKQHASVRRWRDVACEEGDVLVRREDLPGGYYVGPTIVTGIRPEHRIAQEEVFGPVLAVMRASDLDEALDWANGTRFALTGGLFSRSPATIERVRDEFEVGNLYINRSCTGALVERQPFGGFKMSGVGSKAGGPDYLLQFLEPRTITENTMRRGFAPDA